jgi:Fur family transcriptional regulator, ferric uptake regulator
LSRALTIAILVKLVENRYHQGMARTWTEVAQHRLRQAGYRNGPARVAVIGLLDGEDCCSSAADVHESLDGRVGLASVYRVLESLHAVGLVRRVDVGDGIARYEPLRESGEHHHHLVCTECGKVEAFDDPALERAIQRVEASSGYAVDQHDVVLQGACGSCRD